MSELQENQLCHPLQDRVGFTVGAAERFDARFSVFLSKPIERRVRHMIVNPIEWTAMALAKTRFEVIHADAACWPLRDSRVLVVWPEFTAAGGGRATWHGNKGRLFGRDGLSLLGETGIRCQSRNRDGRLTRRRNEHAQLFAQPEVLGHLLAIGVRSTGDS